MDREALNKWLANLVSKQIIHSKLEQGPMTFLIFIITFASTNSLPTGSHSVPPGRHLFIIRSISSNFSAFSLSFNVSEKFLVMAHDYR